MDSVTRRILEDLYRRWKAAMAAKYTEESTEDTEDTEAQLPIMRPFGEAPEPPEAGFTDGPCLRCGEWQTRNEYLFCVTCWRMAEDLLKWATKYRIDNGTFNAVPGIQYELPVAPWAYELAAKFPRDPGPDPQNPTWPSTQVPQGAYWQPEGPKPHQKDGVIRGICTCHSWRWN